jgi:hypothetical protein
MGYIIPKEVGFFSKTLLNVVDTYSHIQLLQSFTGYNSWIVPGAKATTVVFLCGFCCFPIHAKTHGLTIIIAPKTKDTGSLITTDQAPPVAWTYEYPQMPSY